jgi:hypothetical protein
LNEGKLKMPNPRPLAQACSARLLSRDEKKASIKKLARTIGGRNFE